MLKKNCFMSGEFVSDRCSFESWAIAMTLPAHSRQIALLCSLQTDSKVGTCHARHHTNTAGVTARCWTASKASLCPTNTCECWRVCLVGMVHRADALDDTRRVVQRCCAWARHIKPSGVWGASVLARSPPQPRRCLRNRVIPAVTQACVLHMFSGWGGSGVPRTRRCCEAAPRSQTPENV